MRLLRLFRIRDITFLHFIGASERQRTVLLPIQVDLTSKEKIEAAYARILAVTDSIYAIAHFTGILGVSTTALDRFCDETERYSCNAERFKKIVENVEARNVSPAKVGRLALKILEVKRPRQIYKI